MLPVLGRDEDRLDAPLAHATILRAVSLPRVSVIDELVANNARHVADRRRVDIRPARSLAVVTCMDARLDVFAALGLAEGDAHILRNAGGVVTDDVIRSLAISQRLLGTREVMLIHHSDCGMQKISDDGFRAELQEETGVSPSFAIESFKDLDADVRQSILRVRRSAFLPHRDAVRGFVYEIETGRLREVEGSSAGSRFRRDAGVEQQA